MNDLARKVDALAARVMKSPRKGQRRMIAIAGAPASGKSFLAAHLVKKLCADGVRSILVPMDGFHLDNTLLEERGLLARKGAQNTFDIHGLQSHLIRIRDGADVYFPIFDRARDIAVAGAGFVAPDCDTVVVEGNYLLLDKDGWRDLRSVWDLSVMLNVPHDIVRERLIQRWLDFGMDRKKAERRAVENDLVNVAVVMNGSAEPDVLS